MTKPTDAERCLERAAQLRTSPTMGDAIPHFTHERRKGERRTIRTDYYIGVRRRGLEDRRTAVPPFAERTAAERDALRASNAALREALTQIGEGMVMSQVDGTYTATETVEAYQRHARAALAGSRT